MSDTSRARVAPELAPFLDYLPDLDFSQGIDAFRTPFADRPRAPLPAGLEVVVPEERFIPGAAGAPDVRILLYRPPETRAAMLPALLHMHGGGFVLGDPEINDASNRAMVLEHGCIVVSVDYRLAPETRFPGALEDCYAALVWMHGHAGELGLDVSRIAIGGESAGGGHAAALALYARDRSRREGDGPAICFQLLDAPMLDDRTCAAEPHPYCGQFVWSPDKNRFGWRSLLGVEPGGAEVPEGAAPARAQDLTGLPPIFISVGALDLFFEEDLEFARRLARAGVAVELHVTPGAYHGFGVAQTAPQSLAVARLRNDALRRAFAR
ncbi:alpha/beta hydrolase [Caulobacter soli]|uniref:alpha/beta hydrolase n=1 Tax=Caulobacter soli TaxID=2708539 RepID=UPI0013EAD4C2|nr:alpha/beta hydrolase [Caulobacter soli]